MSQGTPSIVLRMYQDENELAILKRLSVGYSFENISDYLLFTLKRAVDQDIEMYNTHVREYNAKLAAAAETGKVVVNGTLDPETGFAVETPKTGE